MNNDVISICHSLLVSAGGMFRAPCLHREAGQAWRAARELALKSSQPPVPELRVKVARTPSLISHTRSCATRSSYVSRLRMSVDSLPLTSTSAPLGLAL